MRERLFNLIRKLREDTRFDDVADAIRKVAEEGSSFEAEALVEILGI